MPNYKGHNVEVLTDVKKKIIDDATKPYDALSAGPFRTALDKMDGVFRKEIINYKIQDGYLVKETSIRDFRDGDYHDTTTVQRITKVYDETKGT